MTSIFKNLPLSLPQIIDLTERGMQKIFQKEAENELQLKKKKEIKNIY